MDLHIVLVVQLMEGQLNGRRQLPFQIQIIKEEVKPLLKGEESKMGVIYLGIIVMPVWMVMVTVGATIVRIMDIIVTWSIM